MRARQRFFICDDPDVSVRIPQDPNQRGKVWQRVERAVRYLWSRGIYPSPTAVQMRLRGSLRRTASLNGIETTTRNRMLKELGIGRQKLGGHHDPDYLGMAGLRSKVQFLESKLRMAKLRIQELEQERKNACT